MEIEIKHLAIHLVDKKDKKLEGPKLSKQEFLLASLKGSIEGEKVEKFFKNHLEEIMGAKEGEKKVYSANFGKDSFICASYEAIKKDEKQFFLQSCKMAQQLYVATPGAASAGLLVVLFFNVNGKDDPFLGLLKMDLREEDKITLSWDEKANSASLIVKFIDNVLPDVGEKVLKWAVLPNPTCLEINILLRDAQTPGVAYYFKDFLGCITEPKEGIQRKGLFNAIEIYAQEYAKEVLPDTAVRTIANKLSETDMMIITPEVIIEEIREIGIFKKFDGEVFGKMLEKEANSEIIHIFPDKIRDTEVEFTLTNGIKIRTPYSEIGNSLKIEEYPNKSVFTIETAPKFERKYVT